MERGLSEGLFRKESYEEVTFKACEKREKMPGGENNLRLIFSVWKTKK